jgi:hypothetical protein
LLNRPKNRRHLAKVLFPVLALVVFAIVARLVLAAGTVTIYVRSSSACTTGCGILGSEWATITAAINDADNRIAAATATGAIIQVLAGNYPERIFIDPNIHVQCASPATTTIDATGKGRAAVIFASGGTGRPTQDFSIDSCKITGGIGEVRATFNAGGGVFVFGDAVISNNVITGNVLSGALRDWAGAGIYVATGTTLITGNTISKNIANPPPGGALASHGLGSGIFVLGPLSGSTMSLPRIEANTFIEKQALGDVGKGTILIDGNPGAVI